MVSWVALNVWASLAFAVGAANAAAARKPVATAVSRVRLAVPARGVVRLILTFRSLQGKSGARVGSGPVRRSQGLRPEFEYACP
ncbi:hypothetical protein EASAB2608_01223 [Streptomyces sp. EAS-AB2608]|nr:hypothetical protein EASAB2608_01223 [Streptomyces sp. EAS-AB2608]